MSKSAEPLLGSHLTFESINYLAMRDSRLYQTAPFHNQRMISDSFAFLRLYEWLRP
jgi:hypothetical protein